MAELIIRCYEIFGENCIDRDEGAIVFDMIKSALDNNNKVIVDFSDVKIAVSGFLSSAIADLVGVYDSDRLNNDLSIINLNPSGVQGLKFAIANAKTYYSKKDKK